MKAIKQWLRDPRERRRRKAAMTEPDSSRPATTSPPAPKLDFEISTPASRGLCNKCAKYNWRFHLTRHLPGRPTQNNLCRYEETLLKAVLEANGRDVSHEFNSRLSGWDMNEYQVIGAPYEGVYTVVRSGFETDFVWPEHTIFEDTPATCSVCTLLYNVSRANGLTLPLVCNIRFSFWVGEESYDRPLLNIELVQPARNWRLDTSYHQTMVVPRWGFGGTNRTTPVGQQIDPGLLSLWYSSYRDHQERGYWIGSEGRPEPSAFRLIDVRSDRVVPAPEDCAYIALSYVWGRISPYTLRIAELQYAQFQDRIFTNSYAVLDRKVLPRTIRDAMFVVESIGERYLWVDSLCIVQDDLEDLNYNLAQMHRIYSSAALTIVAAGGHSADAGLPGLHAGSRDNPLFETVIDTVSLVPRLFAPKDTTWHQRAWTYQEYHYSKRCLIFADQTVLFLCREGGRSEHWPDYEEDMFRKRLDHRSEWHEYVYHVEKYTARHLTHEHDILNGFSAILNGIGEKYAIEFYWGLPQQQFLPALLWGRKTNGD